MPAYQSRKPTAPRQRPAAGARPDAPRALGADEAAASRAATAHSRRFELAQVLTTRACTAAEVADEALTTKNEVDLGRFAPSRWARHQEELDRRLVRAGRELLQSLDELVDDRATWDVLTRSAVDPEGPALTLAARARLQEVLDLDVPVLLEALGYRPKPTPEEWASWLKEPLHRLVEDRTYDRAGLVAQAEWELRLFAHRLRRTLPAGAVDEQSESHRARTALAKVMRGARLAVPASVGVGLGVMAEQYAAGSGESVAAAAGLALGKATGRLTGGYAEAMMASLLLLPRQGQEAEMAGDATAYVGLLAECVELSLAVSRSEGPAGGAEAQRRAAVLVRRSLSGVLQAVRVPHAYVEGELWERGRVLLAACDAGDESAARTMVEQIAETLPPVV